MKRPIKGSRTTNYKHHHETLTEKAYETVKRLILRGELEEGTFLPEVKIIKRFGFGRTPLREACNRLHHERLLEAVPHRGYLIPEISFRTVRNLLEVRHIIESATVELACARATDAQIKELDQLADPNRSRGASFETMMALNKEFHLALAHLTQNDQLAWQLKGILEQTERVAYIELRNSPFHMADSLKTHGPIVAAIRRRDVGAAKHAVTADINSGTPSVLWLPVGSGPGAGSLPDRAQA